MGKHRASPGDPSQGRQEKPGGVPGRAAKRRQRRAVREKNEQEKARGKVKGKACEKKTAAFGQARFGRELWRAEDELFGVFPEDCAAALAAFPELLSVVRPLSPAHRRALPGDIVTLSRLLTTERRDLDYPYWSKPGLISSYLYYFLPWNLVRLIRFFAHLDLPAPQENAVLWDVGSGPLTLPMALWLARSDLRDIPLTIVAHDKAAQPLQYGKELFLRLMRQWGPSTWRIETVCSPFELLAARCQSLFGREEGQRLWLLTAANMLNEYTGRSVRHEQTAFFANDPEEKEQEGFLYERLGRAFEQLCRLTHAFAGKEAGERRGTTEEKQGEDPLILILEPGTRLGGKLIMTLRSLLLEYGGHVLSPCTHDAPCPLLSGRGKRTWCHFTFAAQGAPGWLLKLSEQAGLAKQALSLAPLLFSLKARPRKGPLCSRVLSSPFRVPYSPGLARYACSPSGLLLLEAAEDLACGARLELDVPKDSVIDAKSGARRIPCPGREPYERRP